MGPIEPVYYYIASVNPEGALNMLVDNYGYSMQGDVSTDAIAEALYHIVSTDGHRAFTDVFDLHPDKRMILELYASAPNCMSHSCMPACAGYMHGSHPDKENKIPALPTPEYNKSFFSSPTNIMIVSVGLIATIALLKS